MKRDISNYDPRELIMTKAKEDLIELNKPIVEQFIEQN